MLGSLAWRALMWRNLVYRKRNWVGSIFELLLPVLFVFFWVLIKNAVENSAGFEPEVIEAEFPDQGFQPLSFTDYVNAIVEKRTCSGFSYEDFRGRQRTSWDISGIGSDGYNWAVPFVKCDSRLCEEEGQDASKFCEYFALGLAPMTNGDTVGLDQATAFKEYIYNRYPQLLQENNPETFEFDFIRMFNNNKEIEDYVTDFDYKDPSDDKPKLGFAVVFDGLSDPSINYNYHLRMNTTNFNAPEQEGRPATATMPDTGKLFESVAKREWDACPLIDGTPFLGQYEYSCVGQYMYNGALVVQRLLGDWIMVETGSKDSGYYVSEHGVQYGLFPSKEYIENGFYAIVADFIPLLMILGLLYPVAAMVRYLVTEKELRQKELMKMMSVTESDIGWSWFISFLGFHIISATLAALVSTQFYSNSSGILLWFFWLFTFIATITFCMFLASFFSKATRATLVSLLIFFVGYFLTLVVDIEDGNASVISLVALHPAGAFAFGLQEIGRLEDLGEGLVGSTLNSSDSVSGYNFNSTLGSLIFDCILWGVLSWYLNRVIQADYGQALPFYFPFTAAYWCPSSVKPPTSIQDEETEYPEGIAVEDVTNNLKEQAHEGKSIEIRNLRKVFGEKTAVDGLSLSMYNGQITALLGHNGAGKTTTINMLTGMFAPTDGYALVAGKDIRTDMGGIRQEIGICLQHDCLFPQLTVREHIQFFATVKGLYSRSTRAEANAKIDQSIQDVALYEKRNTFSSNLSGGMKRKLSVAIAFCGDSKTVLLDEPTSGMDPFSRRFTWNVIRQYRQDRCIILTTHFMDEADILGDRIAIMAEGQLRCAGSSLFLKKTYGVGYQLTIEKTPVGKTKIIDGGGKGVATNATADAVEVTPSERDTIPSAAVLSTVDDNGEAVEEPLTKGESDGKKLTFAGSGVDSKLTSIVKTSVPDASLLSNVGTELSFQLPLRSAADFPVMFEELDKEADRGEIVTYGVSITTLDEVFLLVARGDHAAAGESKQEFASNRELGAKNDVGDDDGTKSFRSRMDLETESLFLGHVGALFAKRALNFKRDKKAWCCTTILPSMFVLFGFILFKYVSPDRNLEPLTLNFNDYNPNIRGTESNPKNPVPFNRAGGEYTCVPDAQCMDWRSNFCGRDFKFILEGGNCTISESESLLSELDAGGVGVPDDSFNIESSSYALSESALEYAASQYAAVYFAYDPTSLVDSSSLTYLQGNDGGQIGDFGFNASGFGGDESFVDGGSSGGFGDFGDFGIDLPEGISVNYAELLKGVCEVGRINATNYIDDCDNYGGINYIIRYNFTALHIGPLMQALADESIVRVATGNPSFKVKATVAPMPLTEVEESLGNAEDAFNAWFLIVLSFPFIAGSFATFVVAERESKAKHLQVVAGVKPPAYWISTWLWDTMNYQIPLWITVALMFIFDVETLTTTDRGVVGGIIVLLILFGPAAASFSYIVSFLFSSPSICNLVIIISGFLLGFAGTLATFILRLIGQDRGNPNDKLVNIAAAIEWILRFLPPCGLARGLFCCINITTLEFLAAEKITVWHDSAILYDVIFLAWESVIYLLIAMVMDSLSNNPHAVSVGKAILNIITLQFLCGSTSHRGAASISVPDDSDVVAEQERVLNGGANDDLIVVSQLTKQYDNGKLAVNNISLGIPPGQCFGLLGINGAGKTTTMGILTAEFPPTSGDATLAGFSVTNEPEKTRRRVGYCPQFDAHFTNMTGREHVELYASIKGVPKNLVKEAAAAKLAEVGLKDEDSDRLSAGYSGGMKRRLSLACATIGQPQIVFLDECSTGVDPVARREIWQMVSDMVTGGDIPPEERTSVILTTHSMEECEALCPRIAIMANGKLRCLGSAQQLKTKFGQGYQVEMKVKNVDADDADYRENYLKLVRESGALVDAGEVPEDAALPEVEKFFGLTAAKELLQKLTGDESLSGIVHEHDPAGYLIHKEATSDVGVSLEELAYFATGEIRMKNLNDFVAANYPNNILRERQDTKTRYEVSSEGVRIASIFGSIENHKDELMIAEYGVSQTSLEQVFNMHAAEAEKLKTGTTDG